MLKGPVLWEKVATDREKMEEKNGENNSPPLLLPIDTQTMANFNDAAHANIEGV